MYTYKARALNVVGGDTAWLDVDLGFEVHAHHRFQLAGVSAADTAEALEHLEELLFDFEDILNEGGNEDEIRHPKQLVIQTGNKDGHWVAWLWLAEDFHRDEDHYERIHRSINAQMIKDGHATWATMGCTP